MTLAMLAILGVAEALVWLHRMRTSIQRSAWVSGVSAAMTTGCRLAFIWVGAGAVMAREHWALAAVSYVLPASIATVLAHEWVERRKQTKEQKS